MSHLTSTGRTTGWTVDRQQQFLDHLAISGTVADACELVGLSAASAYKLRANPAHAGFAAAWDAALAHAAPRLVAHAFERAINGNIRQVWRRGELLVTERGPSDRLLMWLLDRIGPAMLRGPAFRAPAPETAPAALLEAEAAPEPSQFLSGEQLVQVEEGFRA